MQANSTVQDYWVNELGGDLYDNWINWFSYNEPANTIAQIIRKFTKIRKSKISILDCACGTGNPSIALNKMGFDVISSDGSIKMIEKAVENARREQINLNIIKMPVLWNEMASFFSDRKFDVVICTGNSFVDVPPENIFSLLKPDGLCIIDVKRYNKQFRELYYNKEKGWTERKTYINRRCLNGGKVQFITRFHYKGRNISGRAYDIKLNVKHSNSEEQEHVFPVWAITSTIILSNMEKIGMKTRFFPTPKPAKWRYDFCIGIKKER
jgi:SAM-dependent methyltransferase